MKRSTRDIILASIAAIILVLVSAGASALITKEVVAPEKPATKHITQKETIKWNSAAAQPAPAPVPNCDDGNIVGALAGGVGGGVVGSAVGDGNGKTAATIAGALGGAYLGKEYLPTQNVTCR
jgi:outer membrane lipoprotein SlyB